MAALYGSKRHQDALEFVAFDIPVLAGVDLRGTAWSQRRERLELLAQAFDGPIRISPVVPPSVALALDMERGDLEGIVLKDRESTYRDGSRAGWFKVKDRVCTSGRLGAFSAADRPPICTTTSDATQSTGAQTLRRRLRGTIGTSGRMAVGEGPK